MTKVFSCDVVGRNGEIYKGAIFEGQQIDTQAGVVWHMVYQDINLLSVPWGKISNVKEIPPEELTYN